MSEFFKHPTTEVRLPSHGVFYPEHSPLRQNGGVLEIKYMTAKEEDIMTSPTLISNGTLVDKLLQSIIVTPGVSYTDLLLGDINAVVITSRVLAYGPEYTFSVDCFNCKEVVEYEMNLAKVEFDDEICEVNEMGEFEFKTPSELNVTIKPLTRGDELKMNKDVKMIQSKMSKDVSPEMSTMLKAMVTSVNGERDRSVLNPIIENLIVADARAIRKKYHEVNPDLNLDVAVDCPHCSHVNEGTMPITANFFWPDA